MTKRMLIDATHAEETRVVILDGTKLEDFDVETSTKKQIKGNIYLAKVTRVEPSLQAAFVEYGGNRHGFLAFGEIHPDYYQIPVADRQALIDEEERAHRAEDDEADHRSSRGRGRGRNSDRKRDVVQSAPVEGGADHDAPAPFEGKPAAEDAPYDAGASADIAETTPVPGEMILPAGIAPEFPDSTSFG